MGNYQLETLSGHKLSIIASALQKAIRRGNIRLALYCGWEMAGGGYHKYVWRRLATIASEDIHDPVEGYVIDCKKAFDLSRETRDDKWAGSVNIGKAILLMCRAQKSRDTDNAKLLFNEDQLIDESDPDVEDILKESAGSDLEIPDYVYDVHTEEGRRQGETKEDFYHEEEDALDPKAQQTLFDDAPDEVYGKCGA